MPGTNPFSKFSDGTNEYEVKDAAARQDLSTHSSSNINTSQGIHGIRYYEGALAYKDGEGNFQEIQTGAGVVELTQQQYDQLSTEDKNKDVIYVITDQEILPADNRKVDELQSSINPFLRQPSTPYSLKDVVYLPAIGAEFFLECTAEGTTGTATPVITPPVTAGQTVSDGTVVWTVRQVLPTSGGTMTGGFLLRDVTTDGLRIFGGTTTNDGAVMSAFGKDNSNFHGLLRLSTVFDAQTSKRLDLWPDSAKTLEYMVKTNGTEKIMDLGGSAIVAKSLGTNGYVKYASGLIIQWGRINLTANTGQSIRSFPVNFTSWQNIFAQATTEENVSNYVDVSIYNITNKYRFWLKANVSCTVNWFAIGY